SPLRRIPSVLSRLERRRGAPAKVPADIVELLHKHVSDALTQPHIRQRVIDMGGVVPGGTSADFGRFMAEDTERWAKVNQGGRHQGELVSCPDTHTHETLERRLRRQKNRLYAAFGMIGLLISPRTGAGRTGGGRIQVR